MCPLKDPIEEMWYAVMLLHRGIYMTRLPVVLSI